MENRTDSRRPGRIAGLLAMVAASSLAAGCLPAVVSQASVPLISQEWKGQVEMKAPLTLAIDNPVGGVKVVGGATEGVHVEAVKKSTRQGEIDAITIDLKGEDDRATLSVKGPKGGRWSVDLVVRVPAETGLEADGGVGDLTVEGLEGKFRAKVGVGNIDGRKLTIRRDSSFQGGTGNVLVEVAAMDEGRSLSARSGVGNVEATLPANLGYQLDAKAGVGDVDLGGLSLTGGSTRRGPVGAEIHGRTRGAEPAGRKVTLESGVGGVALKAR